MALQLNKDTKTDPGSPEQGRILSEAIERLEKVRTSTVINQVKRWTSTQSVNIDIGLMRYQQEAADDTVVDAFRHAATAGSLHWTARTEPAHSNERLTLTSWSWVIAFGSVEERKNLSLVPAERFAKRDDKDYAETRALLRVLQGYLATGALDLKAADAVIATAGKKKASHADVKVAKPYAQGLIALVQGKADEWNAAMEVLVKDHEHEAFRGELVDLPNGYMAAIPLSLLRLGLERGLVCTIKSLHLPVRLVEQAWKLSVSG